MATATRSKHSKLDPVRINQGITIIHPDADQPRKSSNDELAVDIIAVPGLGANPEWTWKSKNKVDWLRDVNMLCRSIPNARIMVFEYESQWFGRGSIDQRLSSVADQLVLALFHSRSRGSTRPIVFVCHCLGGIIVEKALLAAKLHQSDYPNIFMSVVGCVFLGTPFRGTKSQSKASLLAEMAQTVGLGVNSGLVKLLKEGSEALSDLLDDFVTIAKEANMRLFCFFEQHESDMMSLLSKSSPLKHKELIVDEDSAKIVGYGKGSLASDHFELNKFNGPKDGRYIMVSGEINTAVQKASGILKGRRNAIRQTLIDDGTYQTILDAFKVTDPAKDMDNSVRGRPPSQASWALSNGNYIKWKESDTSQVLWIHGSAGKGQAVIASSLVQELKHGLKDESVFLAYFFCDEKDAHRNNALSVMKLLVRQIILRKRDLTEYLLVDKRISRKGDQKSLNVDAMSTADLWASLQSMLKDAAVGKVYFLVNGLDETDGESRTEFLALLNSYLELCADEERNSDESIIKWVFLSRSGRPDIEKSLQKTLVIDMDDKENIGHVNDAVKAEISSQVDRLAKQKNYNTALVYFVKRHIYSRAEGNYIYVNLVIQELKNLPSTQTSISGVRKFLEGFPHGLTEMFEHIRRRVLNPQNEGIEYTKEIFRALILAQRSPSIFELAMMADLPFDERNDMSALECCYARCGAFITISEDDFRSVEWIDIAAKEHLETYAKEELSLSLNDVQHGIIALRCLDYVRKYAPQEVDQDDNGANQSQVDSEDDGSVDENLVNGEQATVNSNQCDNGPDSTEGGQRQSSENNTDQTDHQPYDPQIHDNQGQANRADENSSSEQVSSQNIQNQQNAGQEVPAALDESQQNTSLEAAAGGTETSPPDVYDEPPSLLRYPVDYWLEHAKQAPVDLVEEFDLNDEFWSEDSSPRAAWWTLYREENGYSGLTDTTPLHLAALSRYSALLDHILDNGCADEIQKSDSWGYRPFYWACYSGDIYAVQRLVKSGADINAKRDDGNITALWGASAMGHIDIVKYLLEQNAGVDIQDNGFGTPLYVASENGYVSVVRQLRAAAANVNLFGGLHCRPLNAAAYSGHTEVVELLLAQDVEVDPEEDYKYGSALGAASRKGHAEIVRLLLKKGWDTNRKFKNYNSPLDAAATYGHLEVVQALLETNVDIISREQALKIASTHGKTDVVKELLEQSPNLRHQDAFLLAASYGRDDTLELLQKRGTNQDMLNRALFDASDHEHESTVGLLLKFGADPDAEGQEYGTALIAAAFDGTDDIVRILLENGADVNKKGEKYGDALQTAASFGDVDIVQRLLDHGAHVNTEAGGIYGSALQAACYDGDEALVKLLIDHGAQVDAEGGKYGFPIIAATDECQANIVEILISHGANVHVKDARDNSPLVVLAGYCLSAEAMGVLLDHGAELEATDEKGNTALIATADSGDKDGLKMLLERGANIHARGSEYGTALHAAASEGDEECCELLLNYGANVNDQSGPWHTALQAAALAADLDCIKILLGAGADVHLNGGQYGSALQAAAYSGDLICLQALLDAGADVNETGGDYGSSLQAAASFGNLECMQLLLVKGADVHHTGGMYGSALLGSASKNGNDDCLKKLLEQGADATINGGLYGSVIQAAAVGNNLNMCSPLLEHGASVHAIGGKYGNTLQAAALRANEDFVQFLLQHSVEVNIVGGKYGTALQAAAYANRPEIVTLLLEHHADIRIGGGLYGNALNAAIRKSSTTLLSQLLDETPAYSILDAGLLQAVLYRNAAAVDLFLKYGADVEMRDEILGSAWDALQKEAPIDENSDDEDEEDEDDEDESDDEDDEEGGSEGEEDEEGSENQAVIPDEQDNDASVVDLQLGDSSTEESKILKSLEEAMAKIKHNPGINRFRSVKLKPIVETATVGHFYGYGTPQNADIQGHTGVPYSAGPYSPDYQQGWQSAGHGQSGYPGNLSQHNTEVPAASNSYQAYSGSEQTSNAQNETVYQRPTFEQPQNTYGNYDNTSQAQQPYYQRQYSNNNQPQQTGSSNTGYQSYNSSQDSHPPVLRPQMPSPQPSYSSAPYQQQYSYNSSQPQHAGSGNNSYQASTSTSPQPQPQPQPPPTYDPYQPQYGNSGNNYQSGSNLQPPPPHQDPYQSQPSNTYGPQASSSSYGYPSPNPSGYTSSPPPLPTPPSQSQSGFIPPQNTPSMSSNNNNDSTASTNQFADSPELAKLQAKMSKFGSSVSQFWK